MTDHETPRPDADGGPAPVAPPPDPGRSTGSSGLLPDTVGGIATRTVVAIGLVMAVLVGVAGGFTAATLLGDGGDDDISADVRDAVPDTNMTVNAVPAGDDAAPDEDEVELADDVVVVSGEGGDAVRSVSTDGDVLVLDPQADGVDDLAEGDVLLLTGVTAGRITSIDEVDDGVEVATEPVGLGEVIEDAELAWEPEPVDLGDAVLVIQEPDESTLTETALGPLGPDGAVPDAVPASTSVGGAVPGTDVELAGLLGGGGPVAAAVALPLQEGGGPTPRQATGDIGDWRYRASATTSGDTITFDIVLAKDAGGVTTAVDVHGEVRGVTIGGSLNVDGGSVEGFSIDTPNLAGSADVTGTISVGPEGGNVQVATFEVPLSVQVPFPVYGIPFTIGIEANLEIDPEITTADSAVTGRFRADYSGSAGLSVSNGSLSASGAATPNLEDPMEWVAGMSLTPAALIITVEFPKVSIGLGISVARASAYLMARFAFAPTFSGTTNITPCTAQPMSMVLKAGIEAELLGQEIDVAEAEIARRDASPFYPETEVCQI